jgi:hypothetical protein
MATKKPSQGTLKGVATVLLEIGAQRTEQLRQIRVLLQESKDVEALDAMREYLAMNPATRNPRDENERQAS